MPLIHPRVIEKHIEHIEPISENCTEILQAWSANLVEGVYNSETQNDHVFIQRILVDVLGYVQSGDSSNWTVAKNQPVGRGNVDVALGAFSANEIQILAPFELKGAKTRDLDAVMAGRNKTPVQQAWEYAMDAKGAKWVLVSNYREIRLYAVGYGRKDYEAFDLTKLFEPKRYARFILLLSADNLLGGKTASLLKESEQVDNEITVHLYADYKSLRYNLIQTITKDNPTQTPLEVIRSTQTILDRILFVAFAEDKGLLPDNTLKLAYEDRGTFNPRPVWDNFKGLFNAINKGNADLNIPAYNGGLFAPNPELDQLTISDELCEGFKKIGDYAFDSDVSVNILGHIFEQSISDVEELKANAEGLGKIDKKQSKRKKDGIFYTPPYITHYIVEKAVGGWLDDRKKELKFNTLPILIDEDYASIKLIGRGKHKGKIIFNKKIQKHVTAWEKYLKILSNIKVVDPACGSGAFLNEVFDYLKAEGEVVNNQLSDLKGGQTTAFKWDTHILANNIYGVDLNSESVEITKLSLWLKTANRQEALTYLEDNIKVGNSLIDDPEIAHDLAFSWKDEFAETMSNGGFDVIVGNPPYIDSEEMAKSQPEVRDFISTNYQTTKGNWDIYIAFFELSFRLLKKNTSYLSFITPDKWVSKDFGDQFRITYSSHIKSILVLGREVFEEAKVDSIITTFKSSETKLLTAKITDGFQETVLNKVPITVLNSPFKLDPIFSEHFKFLKNIEDKSDALFSEYLECENACATSDAYELKKIIVSDSHANSTDDRYKVANTGTLDKYIFKWGRKPMKYLKDSYLHPAISKEEFHSKFGATYVSRAKSPKIIIKGLTLLDCALDLRGDFIPGKSTLVVTGKYPQVLKAMCALLNSKMIMFYITQKYASSSYNGGVNFTKDMINNIPIPKRIKLNDLSEKTDETIIQRNLLSTEAFSFLRLVKSELHLSKIPVNMEFWYDDTFKKFTQKIEKLIKPNKLSLSKKAEWMEHFEEEKTKLLEVKNKIYQIDNKIDQIIYALYDLTTEEINLVEQRK